MREHISTAVAAALLVSTALASPLAAQPRDEDDDDGDDESMTAPAPEPAHYEVLDLTKGMRTDVPLTMKRGKDGTLWVGTLQGRIYRSENRRDWDELTVVPQLKELYGFAGQLVLLGHLRSDGSQRALPLNLIPGLGVIPGRSGFSTALLQGFEMMNIDPRTAHNHHNLLSDKISSPRLTGDDDVRFRRSGDGGNPLGPIGAEVAAAGGLTAGAGLSARAPRLSLLQQAKRRPVAAMNLQVLLRTRRRSTRVQRIAIDPKDPEHLFAATGYGLYESRDYGESWVRIFPGITRAETNTREVLYDPHRPNRIFLGTGKGLYVSEDNGLSFSKHGFVPEVAINKIAVDRTNPDYIYIATVSGMYRSNDGGETFGLGYYSTLYLQRTLYWVEIDATNPERVYLGSADGIHTSDRARTVGAGDWETLRGLRLLNLQVPTVTTCPSQPGLIYAQTNANLPVINYHGNSPEAYLLVSRDYGKTWKVALSNRSFGTIGWFEVDPTNCNRVWVLFSNAILELTPSDGEPSGQAEAPRDPDLPSMSAVIEAALENFGVELDDYAGKLRKKRHSRWLPTRLNATGWWARWQVGARTDDFQFAEERYLAREDYDEWRVMAWASWDLPRIYYDHLASPLVKERVRHMNESLRRRAMATAFRHYRELLELRAQRRAGMRGRTLSQRAADRVLEEQHIAVVDLATGGFLSRWIDERRSGRTRP